MTTKRVCREDIALDLYPDISISLHVVILITKPFDHICQVRGIYDVKISDNFRYPRLKFWRAMRLSNWEVGRTAGVEGDLEAAPQC